MGTDARCMSYVRILLPAQHPPDGFDRCTEHEMRPECRGMTGRGNTGGIFRQSRERQPDLVADLLEGLEDVARSRTAIVEKDALHATV